MRLTNLVTPVVAVLALAVGGCAVPTGEEPAPVGTSSSAVTVEEGLPIASGVFGIVNGAFTAYTTIDNLIKFGAPSPTQTILDDLKKANDSLAALQTSQNAQFLQLKINETMGAVNDLDSKIGRAWGDYEDSGRSASFVPKSLSWDDFDALTNRLAALNGTTDAFSVIRQSMLATSGPIADDPLGTYALRMRTRMAQVAFLMTRSAPMTASQQQTYDTAVARFESSFAKATREYFVAKMIPVVASGATSECSGAGRWDTYGFNSPQQGDIGGYATKSQCEADRVNWSAQTIMQTRASVVNTVWSQQDAVATGKWKPRAGTVAVQSATVRGMTSDVTKSLSLLCNGVENCSIPKGTIVTRIGNDPRTADNALLTVSYQCVGDATVRQFAAYPDRDVVLACNLPGAVAGVYVNTSHDANPGRGPEDTVFVESAPTASPALASWTSRPSNASQPTLSMSMYGFDLNRLSLTGATNTVEWGEEGHPTRIQLPGTTSWFGWAGASVPTPSLP